MAIWIHLCYYVLFVLTLRAFWGGRRPVRRAIVAIFASVAVYLALQDLRLLLPDIPPVATTIAIVVLLAEPYLVLRLADRVHPLRRAILLGTLAAYLIAVVVYVVLGIASPLPRIGVSGYFVAVQCVAAVYLAVESTRRVGVSRYRMAIAAASTGLVGLVILGNTIFNLTRAPGQTGPSPLITVFQAMVLIAAFGYLAAFTPPRSLRRLGQRATAFEFVRELALLPRGTSPNDIWALLLETAGRVTNASAAAIAQLQPDGGATLTERRGKLALSLGDGFEPATVARLLATGWHAQTPIPASHERPGSDEDVRWITAAGIDLDSAAPADALLILGFASAPLFAEDDIELLAILATAAARAVDREMAFAGLARQEGLLAEAQQQAHLGSWEWDIDGDTVTWSDELYRIYGFEPGAVGMDFDQFIEAVHPEDRERVAAIVSNALADHQPFTYEHRAFLPDGRVRTLVAHGSVTTDSSEQPVRMVGTCQDVSERSHLEERLTHQAFHDALTGLPNRALFADRVAHAVSRRSAAPQSLAVIFLDLDDFKTVNDTLGHPAGDDLLREAARRISLAVRSSDTVARFGGDEFAILLDDECDTSAAIAVADRILEAFGRTATVHGRSVTISASLGIALNTKERETADELMRNADVAMYRAKASGKRRRELFDPDMYAVAMDRLELKDDLRRAVKRGQLRLHYQPIVDLATRAIIGAEALVRWQHHSRGLMLPGAFIPLAEETGLINGVGRWVLRRACAEASTWSAGPQGQPLPVSVNLSAHQLNDPGLVADVAAALQKAGLPADRLTLEITETVLVDDPEIAVERLRALKALGVRLAIDDFGTGYSSLSYLTQFPIDTLKIDRSFVASLTSGPDGNTVARIIVELGDALGLDIIAEGVEHEDQVASLLGLDCRRGQGFLFSRPIDAVSLLRFLDGRTPSRAVGQGGSKGTKVTRAGTASRPESSPIQKAAVSRS
jgi:diguanylate cyclase (GGDEF)-like protein/PAS domain S-box-containing protein